MKVLPTTYITKRVIFSLLVSVCILLTLTTLAHGQQRRSVTITPTVEVTSAPGEEHEGIIKIKNGSPTPLTFDLDVRDFIVEDNAGTPTILVPGTFPEKYSASAWLGLAPNNFTIEPGGEQEVQYFLKVPANATPGGHYAAVIQEPKNADGTGGSGAGVTTQLGTLFYVTIPGDIVESAEVTQFKTNGFQEYGPVSLATEIKNNSGIHIKPKGTITVKNTFGKVVEVVNIEEHNIFPEVSFLYENTFGKRFMLGKYTLTLAASYGQSGNLPLTATATIVIFPWKLAAVILLVVVAILLGVLVVRKRKEDKDKNTEKPTDKPAADGGHPTPQS